MMAIGLSIHINCESYIEWHINNGSIENVGGQHTPDYPGGDGYWNS